MSIKLKRNMQLACDQFPNHDIWVTRAAKDGTWIDVFIYQNSTRTSWSKRMPLPLTDAWTVLG